MEIPLTGKMKGFLFRQEVCQQYVKENIYRPSKLKKKNLLISSLAKTEN